MSIHLSPAKHLADSKAFREKRQPKAAARQRSYPGTTSADFIAGGGRVEEIACTITAPTRYPRPNFSRGKGGIG